MAKNWMKQLQNLEGAIVDRRNPYANVIRTPSPSVNFVFGRSHGLPLGYTLVMYGPPKSGKSLLMNAMVGQLHRDDPDAIAVKFNTEFRDSAQLQPDDFARWGIDPERYVSYEVNSPDLIFDRIEKEIGALCQEGAPIKLVLIDSITGIQGRRAMNAESVMTQQIGDLALTLQDGFKRILPVQRKNNFAVVLSTHVSAEMDQIEQMRGNKVKMSAAFGVKHYAEYFMMVEPNLTAAGKKDLLDEAMEDDSVKDLANRAEKTGHKIRVCMKDSSLGPKGRSGEFTIDYAKGVVKTHEEVFLLGTNRNIVTRPNQQTYVFGDRKWAGKAAFLQALKEDPDLCEKILTELRRRDMSGTYAAEDEAEAKKLEESSPEESA